MQATLDSAPEGRRNVARDLDRLRYLVRLQLNPAGKWDREIEILIEKIPKLVSQDYPTPFMEAVEELVRNSQQLLKEK